MHRGTITVLFDIFSGQHYYFQESWELLAPTADEAMKRLLKIAQGRTNLLARNTRVVKLALTGATLQHPMPRGTAGEFAHPQDKLLLRRDGIPMQRSLCGIAREYFSSRGTSAIGTAALDALNQILRECECIVIRNGKPEPIGNLQATRIQAKLAKSCKKATRKGLISMLGPEDGEIAWASRQTAKKLETGGGE